MRARSTFTTADQQQGYPETRAALAGESTERLVNEYRSTTRDCFGAMFGHNAKRFRDLVADELLKRGVTEIPNIFGPIPVCHF